MNRIVKKEIYPRLCLFFCELCGDVNCLLNHHNGEDYEIILYREKIKDFILSHKNPKKVIITILAMENYAPIQYYISALTDLIYKDLQTNNGNEFFIGENFLKLNHNKIAIIINEQRLQTI